MVDRAMDETAEHMQHIRRAKLLSDDEIRDVTRRRRDHEYQLRARGAPRSAFLQYAEFEREVAALLRTRAKKRKVRKSRSDRIVGVASSRINLVYSRAVKRFKGDVPLWLHYARHCVDTNAHRVAASVLARAMAMRPDSADVWLAAIAFHFDTIGDVTGARKLAQRALRLLPETTALWIHYFRLELSYLCKAIARRVTMQVPVPDSARNAAETLGKSDANAVTELGDDAVQTTNEGNASDEVVGEKENETDGVAKECGARPLSFWQGGIPFAVLRQAKETMSLETADIIEYWKITTEIPFTPAPLIERVVSMMQSNSIVARCIIARRIFDVAQSNLKHIALPEPLKLKKDTMNVTPNNNAYKLALTSLKACVPKAHSDLVQVLSDANPTRAEAVSCATIVSDFMKRAKLYMANELAEELVDELNALERRVTNTEMGVDQKELTIEAVVASGTYAAWQKLLDEAQDASPTHKEEIRKALKESIAVPFRSEEKDRIGALWLKWELEFSQLVKALDALTLLPPSSKQLLMAAAQALKKMQTTAQEGQEVEAVRRKRGQVFDKLSDLRSCKNDVQFWLDYVQFEQGCADGRRSKAALWKAKKSLSTTNVQVLTEKLLIRSIAQ